MKVGMGGVMRVIMGMRVIVIVMMTVLQIFVSLSLDPRFSLTTTTDTAHGIFLLEGWRVGLLR
jgi:hypothetical protein